MAYTNSNLVAYTKLSPNHSGARTHSIDRITPHCVVGQCTAEGLGDWFAKSSTQASSNYGIDRDGRVGLYVEEKNRSWCSSSNANDQRAVTIECASDTSEPYAFRDVVYQKLIILCVDICRRNGKNKLIWFGDKEKTLNYSPKAGEMILTVHRWFANKSCPGNWMYARMGDLAAKVTAQLGGSTEQKTEEQVKTSGLQATALKDLSEADAIKKVGALFTVDMKKSGILASVSLAQFILESGYGKSELAQNANNCFGMKKSLSGNTWAGTAWDGKSVYTKKTKEQNADGSYVTITADFRKYPCIEDSIADHSAYLLGAMSGSKQRYAGLKGCTDYKKAVQIIKDGGYATSLSYVSNLCSIIERWNLTQYDTAEAAPVAPAADAWYRVRKSWGDAASQVGAFKVLNNAKTCADEHPGTYVFDPDGVKIYTPKSSVAVPFLVKVSIRDLNIRKGPGTNYGKTGLYTGIGVFTIVEVADGQGSSTGWGRLKSGAGWCSLDYCQKI
ncbi:MAG: glucosaminidase domain-containing protein [Lachnospiraceae bacterium]|nr:glucosaminidase domain-containing protein [Lachnospiraceae bacterium]